MNYNKIYNNLIIRARSRVIEGYKEKHHIIPRCIGGNDEIENLVALTPEEHYVAHQLLIKIYPGVHKLVFAAKMMSMKGNKRQRNNKLYGWLRRLAAQAASELQKGRPGRKHTEEEKKKISEAGKGRPSGMKGKVQSDESKQKISDTLTGIKRGESHRRGKTLSEETKQKISESKKKNPRKNYVPHNVGIPISEEQKDKLRESYDAKEVRFCLHCGFESKNYGILSRWHNDNCRKKGDVE